MNGMMELIKSFDAKTLPIKHIPGPEGVRGRNSNNDLIKERLGWAPSITLEEGLKVTYRWIATQLSSEDAKDVAALAQSKVCSTMAPKALGELRKGDMHD